jgi:putative ABC transport system permease protein
MKTGIRPRWRKVISDLWDNKARTILVVLSIAVGVFAVGMIVGAYYIISNDMSTSYASTNPANIEIWTDDFDDNLVKSVQKIPGVKAVEGRRFVNVRARTGASPWTSLDLIAQDNYENSQINLTSLVEGSTIPDDKQVLIEKDTLEDMPVELGQAVEFQLADGTTRMMPVTGIVHDQSTGAGDFLGSPLGYTSFGTLQWLKQPEAYNRMWVTVEEYPNDEAYIRQVANEVFDKVEKSGRQVYRSDINLSNQHPMTSTVQAVLGILLALGILIVFLSSSLIANTLNALLTQHTRFIGVMKLVGARSRQIFVMYMVLILIFSLIALAIAIPLGAQAAYALSMLISSMLNFSLLGYRIIPQAMLAQIIIALLVPLAAGLIPIYAGSRITVQKAISGNVQNGGGSYSAKTAEIPVARASSRWISRPLLISLRNTFRKKGRLALTLFTLTMGGAVFIAVFNVRVALNDYIGDISNYFLADVVMTTDRPYRISEITQEAERIPGVQAIEGWSFASAEIIDENDNVIENVQFLAPPADSKLVQPIMVAGRWIRPGERNALTISESIYEKYPGIQPGDYLRMKVAGQEDNWQVVGIYKFVGIQDTMAYADYTTISELIGLPGKAFSFRIVTDNHSKTNQERMSALIDQHFREQGYKVNEVEPGNNMMKVASEGLNTLITFLLIMALLTALVGSMGLTGTMSMNVLERTREIGVMRSIGAIDRVIIKTVIVEGMVIGVISWILGALLSFPITSLLSTIISLAIFETQIEVAFTLEGFLIWLGLVIVLSALASVLPARNAARLTIREVLAYE